MIKVINMNALIYRWIAIITIGHTWLQLFVYFAAWFTVIIFGLTWSHQIQRNCSASHTIVAGQKIWREIRCFEAFRLEWPSIITSKFPCVFQRNKMDLLINSKNALFYFRPNCHTMRRESSAFWLGRQLADMPMAKILIFKFPWITHATFQYIISSSPFDE